MLKDKKIIVGVTGGIAAYKTPLLVRELVKAGAEVQVVMTCAAQQFVTPLTLSTVARRDVITEMFGEQPAATAQAWTQHIGLALWADVMMIAPATAHTIAKLAHGFADDFLSTLVLALRCPLLIAPSMDVDMYLNPTTQQNLASLKEAGYFLLPPDEGELASGLTGAGRLPEIETLIKAAEELLDRVHQDLRDKNILVTAGPTYEPIDPVRFIGNSSSGKMGFALAHAAALRGANVTLVAGPVQLRTPRNVRRIDVRTARDMYDAVHREFDQAHALIMAAAVADYTVAQPATQKIKREQQSGDTLTLTLSKNPDILRSLGERKTHQVIVGFALETDNGVANAQAKAKAKHADMIVLNNPSEEGSGFHTDTNRVTFVYPDGAIEELPLLPKFDVAMKILDRIQALMRA